MAHGLSSCGSWAVERRLSCSAACGIFLDQGSNPCPCIARQILNHCATREVRAKLFYSHISQSLDGVLGNGVGWGSEGWRQQPSSHFRVSRFFPSQGISLEKGAAVSRWHPVLTAAGERSAAHVVGVWLDTTSVSYTAEAERQ